MVREAVAWLAGAALLGACNTSVPDNTDQIAALSAEIVRLRNAPPPACPALECPALECPAHECPACEPDGNTLYRAVNAERDLDSCLLTLDHLRVTYSETVDNYDNRIRAISDACAACGPGQ